MELIASALHCVRGGRDVFAGVSFALAAGQALLVTGPNGAGKSSLLRMLAGLLRPAAGSIVLRGADPDHEPAEECHLLGHLDAVKPSLSVEENLQFWSGFMGGGPGLPPGAALASVGLQNLASLPAAYLSAGQRRRLSIARLLVVGRPIWLVDEPTSALDASGQERFSQLTREHLDGGGIVVAATHAPLGLDGAQELQLGDAA